MKKQLSTKLINTVLNCIGVLGMIVAVKSVNTCCLWFYNQPKVPEKLLK